MSSANVANKVSSLRIIHSCTAFKQGNIRQQIR
jgi:hypothetical protein